MVAIYCSVLVLAALEAEEQKLQVESHWANDLQEKFEVLPTDGPGWLGADSDVSLIVGGGPTGKRSLWIFADTYISGYNETSNQRIWAGKQMPHSTIALAPLDLPNGTRMGRAQYHWRKATNGTPVSFFQLPAGDEEGKPLLWPVAGLASRDGRSVVLLAQRILGGLNVVGTTSIVATGTEKADPITDWKYTTTDQQPQLCPACANASLNFFSAIAWASPNDTTNSTVLLFGHNASCNRFEEKCTLVGRTDFNKLLQVSSFPHECCG
jgi:hypothetical protein